MTFIDYMNDLKVEVQVPTTGLQNLIKNTDGEQGGWGWITPGSGSLVEGATYNDRRVLRFKSGSGSAYNFYTEALPISPGQWAVGRMTIAVANTGTYNRYHMTWLDANKNIISASTYTGYMANTNDAVHYMPAVQAPAGAAYFYFVVDLHSNASGGIPAAGTNVYFYEPMAAVSSTSTGFGSIRENLFPDPACDRPDSWESFPGWSSVIPVTGPSFNGTGAFRAESANNTYGGMARSQAMFVTAGEYYTASMHMTAYMYGGRIGKVGVQWAIDGVWQNVIYVGPGIELRVLEWSRNYVTMRAPEGATTARMFFFVDGTHGPGYQDYHYFDAVMFEKTNLLKDYFDGDSTDTATVTYNWQGTTDNSVSTAQYVSSGFEYQPPYAWLPITGSINAVEIDRESMNIGTMSVRIKDETLDPAGLYDPILKPGKRIRVQSWSGYWYSDNRNGWVYQKRYNNLFVGKISNAHVDYDKAKKVNAPVDTTITINAVDAMADLANQGENRSVALVSQLPYILEGKGIPWNCNGITSQLSGTTPTVVYNDNLSIADQVVITRDTDKGIAFIDKDGILNALSGTSLTSGWQTSEWFVSDNANKDMTNQWPNPGFETASPMPLVDTSGGDSTTARSTSAARSGTNGLRVTAVAPSGTGLPVFENYSGGNYTVTVPRAGWYDMTYYIRSSQAGAWVRCLEGGWGDYHDITLTEANTWYKHTVKCWAFWDDSQASYVVYAQWYLYKDEDYYWPDQNTTWDLDDFELVEGDAPLSYSEIDVDWDTDRVMNQIHIKHLTTNAEGNAEEVDAGTYQDAASVATYGPRRAEYTIVGNAPNFTTFANTILANNATPTVRANSLTMPIDDFDSRMFASGVDLGDLIHVRFDTKVDEEYRIATLKHRIGVEGWFVDVTFETASSNPAPQYTPAPPVDTSNLYNTGWIQPALANNWGYYSGTGSNWGPLAYRRLNGIVYMRGLITKTVGSTAEGVFQLPVGFRPAYHHMVPMVNNSPDYARMDVQSDGWVVFPQGVPNVAFVSVNTCWVADA